MQQLFQPLKDFQNPSAGSVQKHALAKQKPYLAGTCFATCTRDLYKTLCAQTGHLTIPSGSLLNFSPHFPHVYIKNHPLKKILFFRIFFLSVFFRMFFVHVLVLFFMELFLFSLK